MGYLDNHRGIVPTAFQRVDIKNIYYKIMLATRRDNAPVLVRCLYVKILVNYKEMIVLSSIIYLTN